MYVIRTQDDHPATVLASADTLDAAITATDYLAAVTARQLAANGEGFTDFWLQLAADGTEAAEEPYLVAMNGAALLDLRCATGSGGGVSEACLETG